MYNCSLISPNEKRIENVFFDMSGIRAFFLFQCHLSYFFFFFSLSLPHSIYSKAQAAAHLTAIQSQPGHMTVVKTDHKIFFTVIITLLLIQEGQLPVTGERTCMCTRYWSIALEVLSLTRNRVSE